MGGVLDTLTGLTSPWGYLLVALLAGLEAAAFVGLIIPGEAAMLTGGFLVHRGHAELVPMMLAPAVGGIVGDSAAYELGRRLGPRLRRSWPGRGIGAARWDRAEAALHRHGPVAVFGGRFIGVLRALVPPLAGMAGMPYRRFLLANAAGGLLWGPVLVAAGYLAGGSYDRVARRVSWAGLALAGLLAAAVVCWAAARLAGPRVRRGFDALADAGRRLGLAAELSWLAAAITVAGAATVALAALIDEVGDREQLVGIDRCITRWLVGHRAPALTGGFRAITALGSEAVLLPLIVVVVGVLVWRARNGWLRAGLFAVANAGAASLAWLLKDLVDRPRPPVGGQLVAVDSASFPSGHATQAAAFFGGLALLVLLSRASRRRKTAVVTAAGALTVLIGVSRVYLGVHWASDVAASYLLALGWLAALGTIVAGWAARPVLPASRWLPLTRWRSRRQAA